MAARDAGGRMRPPLIFLFFSILLFIVASFFFSAPRSTVVPEGFSDDVRTLVASSCDYSDGSWIRGPRSVAPRYDSSCKEIYKGWNCISCGKANARALLQWRWKPSGCDLPPLDPVHFFRLFRNTNIGFVGDSLNRNMFISLLCMLRSVSVGEVRKWRPAGADRGFTFLHYNLTLAYHRTNLLARYSRWSASSSGGKLESLGYKQGYQVDVDVPEQTWAEAPFFHDILVINTGHWWWAPSKFDPLRSPLLFFEKGMPVIPPLPPHIGFGITLKHMSPRHFEGGDWNHGGSCRRVQPLLQEQVEDLFSLEKNGTNVEARLINQHLFKALNGSRFHILDITHMSEFRADAHPSTTGGKKHADCMHWCLPGLTDSWNDLLMAHLKSV
ncbi:hypothetical protein HPP92_014196 [Vanilla planifolia]|uniref:Trichome birefringence-like N-terminal domain-containing protein n=1 Tax=Vanilla planifolia TaxID=51239 RepID=A0A835UYQ0_VANPL|nr:hypothetical protein HPP92_014196 [Vanilla planifolia]